LSPRWSPDSKWIAYNKILKNHLRAVFVYSLDTGKSTQITDGLSDADYAQWDKNGKYLYFTASTNRGLSTSWLDMSSIDRKVTRSVYMVVLRKEDPSPIAPESDDEKPADASKKDDKDKDIHAPFSAACRKGRVDQRQNHERGPLAISRSAR